MILSKASIRRPVTLLMVVLTVALFGIIALRSMPVDLISGLNMPIAYVRCVYSGASPSDVETLVTSVLERSLSTMPGLKSISSTSAENYGVVVLQFAYGTNMTRAMLQVREKVDLVRGSLPEGASDPIAMEADVADSPVCVIAVTGPDPENLLAIVKETIVPAYQRIEGVGAVELSGGVEQEIRVDVRPEALERFGLSISQVSQMIGGAQVTVPVGSVPYGSRSLLVSGEAKLTSIEQIRDIAVTAPTGAVVRMSDLADIFERPQERRNTARVNGRPCVLLSVNKLQSANALRISDEALLVTAELNENPDFELVVINNQGRLVRTAISGVGNTLMLGGLLAVGMLWLGLGSLSMALIIGTSIPFSVLAAFSCMFLSGMTLNIISLGGLVIGVGMMVDNSIVVLESIFSCRERGMDALEAAMEGTRWMGGAVMSSTLTNIIVFVPIVFIAGLTREIFGQAAMSITYSISASYIVAFTVVPCLYVMVNPKPKLESKAALALDRLAVHYAGWLRWCIARPGLVVLAAFSMLLVSLRLVPMIGSEMLPPIDQGQITVSIEMEAGTSLDKLIEKVAQVEALVDGHPDVENYYVSAGGTSSSTGFRTANMMLMMRDDRKSSIYDVTALLRDGVRNFTDARVNAVPVDSLITAIVGGMGMGGSGVVVQVSGADDTSLRYAVNRIADMAWTVPGVYNVISTTGAGSPKADIEVDPIRAASLGLTSAQVLQQARTAVTGSQATTITRGEVDVPVRVGLARNRYDTIADLEALPIRTPLGFHVPLRELASITQGQTAGAIQRQGSRRVMSVNAQADSATQSRTAAAFRAGLRRLEPELPRGIEISYAGQEQLKNEAFSGLSYALLLSLALVFMIMAAQFESIVYSLVVMVTVPLSFVGGAAGLLIGRTTLNITSFIGIIMLVGVVVNNAIVLVDTVNQLRGDEGMPLLEALVEGGRMRLRPILMTTGTTILGLLPASLRMGKGTELMAPMALVTMGGLLSATLLTLVVIPCMYLLTTKKDKKKDAEVSQEAVG